MVLAVVPCNDIHAQSPNNSKDSYSTISNSEDSHSKDKGDICSPLCTCNCCQITVASFKSEPLPLQKRSLNIFQKNSFSENDFAYLVYDQIWQPPKI
jgi:hypothetical protein